MSEEAWLTALRNEAATSEKRWSTAILLSVFLGIFGADRFYLGFGVIGLVKFFTLGLLGIWWVADILILACGAMKDANGCRVRRSFK